MVTPSRYCEPSDLYGIGGLPRGSIPNPGRMVGSVELTGNVISLDGHGFAEDDVVRFRVVEGVDNASLPSPLVAETEYFAIPLTDSTFQVAASSGGAAIDLTTTGAKFLVWVELPIDAAIEWASDYIDQMLVGNAVPLEAPFPRIIVDATATLAAWKLTGRAGGQSLSLDAVVAMVRTLLQDFRRGVPVRGAVTPAPANLAVSGAGSSSNDPRGWTPCGGGIP